jgi:hypothetical protein
MEISLFLRKISDKGSNMSRMAGGELCLTGTGRLGVVCSCHNVHMSVTKFTQVLSDSSVK